MSDSQNSFGDDLPDEWVNTFKGFDHGVVILPEAVEGAVGIYRDDLVTLAKEMRSAGIDAAYAHDQEHRTWSGRMGAPVLVPILLAIGESTVPSAAFFFLEQWLTSRFPDTDVSVRVVHKSKSPDEKNKDVLKISGLSGADAAKAIREFERGRSKGG